MIHPTDIQKGEPLADIAQDLPELALLEVEGLRFPGNVLLLEIVVEPLEDLLDLELARAEGRLLDAARREEMGEVAMGEPEVLLSSLL